MRELRVLLPAIQERAARFCFYLFELNIIFIINRLKLGLILRLYLVKGGFFQTIVNIGDDKASVINNFLERLNSKIKKQTNFR